MGSPYRHKLQVEMKPIGEVSPWALNPRDNDAAAERLAYTISAHGWTNPILLDRSGQIIAGHTRLKAALRLGLTEVPTIALDVEGPEAAAIAIADNRLGEFADWDEGALSALLQELDDEGLDLEAVGYGDEDLAAMLQSLDTADKPDAPEPEEPPEEPESRFGEVYELGPHRLICGDSTDPKVWAELMRGERADLVWTDPPYNVGGRMSAEFYPSQTKAMRDLAAAEWDVDFQIIPALDRLGEVAAEDCSFYVCTSHLLAGEVWAWMERETKHTGFAAWCKPNPMPSLAKRHWVSAVEIIAYATRGKHTFNYPKEGNALNYWEMSNRSKGERAHPTQKPLALPLHAMKHSAKPGDLVVDGFGGSGSTLLAAAQYGARCYTVEIDPGYCDVIRRRWTAWADEAGVDAGPGALR